VLDEVEQRGTEEDGIHNLRAAQREHGGREARSEGRLTWSTCTETRKPPCVTGLIWSKMTPDAMIQAGRLPW
jgi:hypothetical protein